MTPLALWLIGCGSCGGLPEEIPDQPGSVSETQVPDLITVTSPDFVYNLWLVMYQLSLQDYRDCPQVFRSSATVAVNAGGADGCLDSASVRWVGDASISAGAGGSHVFSFNDFGPSDGVLSPWTATGSVIVTPTPSNVADRIQSDLALRSLGPGDDVVLYNSTTGGFVYYDAVVYSDHFYGQVGLEGWGTADIDGNRVPLGVANGCLYARHYAGTIALFGSNEAVLSFRSTQEASAAEAPPPAPGDTAGDTGGFDTSGADADADTDADTDTDTSPPTGDSAGVCGDCTLATIDGTVGAACIQPERSVDWPFYAPF